MRRQGIKILGLSLLTALGLMAVTASAAHAASGDFTLKGQTFTSLSITEKTVLGTAAAGELLVPGIGLAIGCTGGTFSGSALAGGVVHGTILFSGCIVLGSDKFCKTYETEANHIAKTNPGNLTAGGLGLILLHKGEHYVVFLGHPFSTVWINGTGCTLPLNNTVSGTVAFKLPSALTVGGAVVQPIENVPNENELHALGLLLNPTLLGLGYLHLGLFYGNEPAHVDDGNATADLSTGEKWGAQ